MTFVQEALDLAHQRIPKMLVQVVPQYDISTLRYMATDMSCDFIQKWVSILLPQFHWVGTFQFFNGKNQFYHLVLNRHVSSGVLINLKILVYSLIFWIRLLFWDEIHNNENCTYHTEMSWQQKQTGRQAVGASWFSVGINDTRSYVHVGFGWSELKVEK